MRGLARLLSPAALGVLVGVACLTLRLAVVTGGSMEPALHAGDVCVVSRRAEAGVGDVLLFRDGGRLPVLHRIVSREADGAVRTRGDANPVPDFELVDRDSHVGKVVLVLPFGTAVRGWMQSSCGATLLNQSNTRQAMTERRSRDSSAVQGEGSQTARPSSDGANGSLHEL